MSVPKTLLIVPICATMSMVVTTAAAQDQVIDYRMIILPVKVSQQIQDLRGVAIILINA